MIDPEEISESEVEELIETLSEYVVSRGLEAPAIMFLEMNKPLGFLSSQALIVTAPFSAPLFGIEKVGRFSKLLSNTDYIEKLMTRIEEKSSAKKTKPAEQE